MLFNSKIQKEKNRNQFKFFKKNYIIVYIIERTL